MLIELQKTLSQIFGSVLNVLEGNSIKCRKSFSRNYPKKIEMFIAQNAGVIKESK